MAFWDHISQKASETTGKAVQKAKDLSDVARLNAAISEEENKIRELYYQIGKLYSAMHMQDAEPAFADLVAAVAEANNKIVCCKQQILDIKGVISCPRCGAEVAVGSAFCSACGSPIAGSRTPEQEGMVHCEHCGALIKKRGAVLHPVRQSRDPDGGRNPARSGGQGAQNLPQLRR